ncbi:MAG: hypothetical protein V9G24_08850 [Rhodoblastus sp.]
MAALDSSAVWGSDRETALFADLVLASVNHVATEPVIGMLPMIGRKYSRQLMVIGRAPNGWNRIGGWENGIEPSDLGDEERRWSFAQAIYRSVSETKSPAECPMSWVTNQWSSKACYNSARSAFWRVIRSVVARLNIADVDGPEWPSHLVWSNLYKIAPAQGGNPHGELRRSQLAGCRTLLQWELETFRPERILILSGWCHWAEPFLQMNLRDQAEPSGGRYVERTGRLNFCSEMADCVVACHPQGKREADWLAEVIAAFSGCDPRPGA